MKNLFKRQKIRKEIRIKERKFHFDKKVFCSGDKKEDNLNKIR